MLDSENKMFQPVAYFANFKVGYNFLNKFDDYLRVKLN